MTAWRAPMIKKALYEELTICSGLQTRGDGLANKGHFQLTFRANRPTYEPTVTANEPTLNANSLQTAC